MMHPQDPKCSWTLHPDGPRMCDGINPLTKKPQSFYFPDDHPHYPGWFKGMEQIICERGLWPESGLPVECAGNKCPQGQSSCCCCHLLFTQTDFVSQKPLLQEHIESRGHLCDFYPKYHCELNFIEQYWGAAKLRFQTAGHARTLEAMQKNMLACLDDIPLEQIRRCVVSLFVFPDSEFTGNLFSGLQIDPHALFQLIVKGCLVLRLHGQTRSTMAIVLFPLRWSHW